MQVPTPKEMQARPVIITQQQPAVLNIPEPKKTTAHDFGMPEDFFNNNDNWDTYIAKKKAKAQQPPNT